MIYTPSQIDLWHISLSLQENQSYLDEIEYKRAEKFQFPIHRQRFIQSRIAMKTILSKYLACHPTDIHFEIHPYGKPFLPHPLTFNVSHSGNYALLAIGHTHPLGVDIERLTSRAYEGIASRAFSKGEQIKLKALPKSLQPLAFFNIWAQKEAFIKAIGLGLRYPTESFDVPLFPQAAFDLYDPLHQQPWRMHPFMPAPAFAGALCYHPSITTLRSFYYAPD